MEYDLINSAICFLTFVISATWFVACFFGNDMNINYIKLKRTHTDSSMTIHLPYQMPFSVAEKWVIDEYPGWEIDNGSLLDPEYANMEW